MTLLAEDPSRIAGESLGAAAARWSFSGVAVALAFSGALWFASNLPAPEGARGDLNEAIIIDLEPLEAIEEAPPPAPEPAPEPPGEEPVAETPPPPPEPIAEQPPPPEPPPPEPEAQTPPDPTPPPPEPVAEPEPTPPEPVVEQPPPPEPPPPEPIPEPAPPPPEPVPELPQNDAAEAVLNAPVPAPKPTPPRPKVERREPVKQTRREPPKEQPRRQASTAPASSAPAARNTASAPRVSQATWARQVISRIRSQAPRTAGAAGLTARVAFSIDRSGRVVSASIASSSGDAGFDREAVALVRRASPVPAPPEGVGGRTTALTVPVRSR